MGIYRAIFSLSCYSSPDRYAWIVEKTCGITASTKFDVHSYEIMHIVYNWRTMFIT